MLLTVFFISDKCMSKGIFEARKLDNQTKSSVVHSLSSVLSGVRIIRGFERESLFQKRYLFFATVLHYTILILHIYIPVEKFTALYIILIGSMRT